MGMQAQADITPCANAEDVVPPNPPSPVDPSVNTVSLTAHNPSDVTTTSSDSFLVDADGNGSVAGILGETLDKCAIAIEEMVSELKRSDSSVEEEANKPIDMESEEFFEAGEIEEANDNPDVREVCLAAMESSDAVEIKAKEAKDYAEEEYDDVEDGKPTHVENRKGVSDSGTTILASVESDEPKIEASKTDSFNGEWRLESESSEDDSAIDEWQVVDENNMDVVEDNAEASAVAAQLQLIGSSLFNSGMESNREQENVSHLTESEFSTASSVPTNVDSTIASTLERQEPRIDRWDPQLKQLEELGFDKDRCVEVLERLEAANIGVGSFDEVITVAQVVHELFK